MVSMLSTTSITTKRSATSKRLSGSSQTIPEAISCLLHACGSKRFMSRGACKVLFTARSRSIRTATIKSIQRL